MRFYGATRTEPGKEMNDNAFACHGDWAIRLDGAGNAQGGAKRSVDFLVARLEAKPDTDTHVHGYKCPRPPYPTSPQFSSSQPQEAGAGERNRLRHEVALRDFSCPQTSKSNLSHSIFDVRSQNFFSANPNASIGTIGEYATSGKTVNTGLISGLGAPVALTQGSTTVPGPSAFEGLLVGTGMLGLAEMTRRKVRLGT